MPDAKQARQNFDEIDKDRDGYITVAELKAFFGEEAEYSFLPMTIRDSDADGDQRVSWQEYAQWFAY